MTKLVLPSSGRPPTSTGFTGLLEAGVNAGIIPAFALSLPRTDPIEGCTTFCSAFVKGQLDGFSDAPIPVFEDQTLMRAYLVGRYPRPAPTQKHQGASRLDPPPFLQNAHA